MVSLNIYYLSILSQSILSLSISQTILSLSIHTIYTLCLNPYYLYEYRWKESIDYGFTLNLYYQSISLLIYRLRIYLSLNLNYSLNLYYFSQSIIQSILNLYYFLIYTHSLNQYCLTIYTISLNLYYLSTDLSIYAFSHTQYILS